MEEPQCLGGREGRGHVPSSLAQNWLCGEEPAAPSAVGICKAPWRVSPRELVLSPPWPKSPPSPPGLPGFPAIPSRMLPGLVPGPMASLFREESFSTSWRAGYHNGAPSHPTSPFILTPTLPERITVPIMQSGEVMLQSRVSASPQAALWARLYPPAFSTWGQVRSESRKGGGWRGEPGKGKETQPCRTL